MKILLKASIVLAALTIFLTGCSGETTTPANTPGETFAPIVFIAPSRPGQDFSNNIYIMEASGKNMRQLTGSGKIGTAQYSPEAGKILYSVHYDAAAFHWHIMDVDGGNQKQLTGEPTIGELGWLPGEDLVYEKTASHKERERYIKIFNFKTGREKKITAAPLHYENYSLAPGGGEIWCLGSNPGDEKHSLLYKELEEKDWNTAVEEVPFPGSTSRIEGWSPGGNYLAA